MTPNSENSPHRYFRKFKEVETGHPIVRELFRIANTKKVSWTEISRKAGVHAQTGKDWRKRSNPGIGNIEAVLNVLGYTLTIRPLRGDEAP